MRTVREECLDWLLIGGRRQLERVLRTYVDHYNRERPHRALDLANPEPRAKPARIPCPNGVLAPFTLDLGWPESWAKPVSIEGVKAARIRRRDRLGGLLHEYARAA